MHTRAVATQTDEKLSAQAGQLYKAAKYAEAIFLLEKVLAIVEKVFGPEDAATAQSLNNLALLYDHTGAYAQPEPLYQQALAIREQVSG